LYIVEVKENLPDEYNKRQLNEEVTRGRRGESRKKREESSQIKSLDRWRKKDQERRGRGGFPVTLLDGCTGLVR
jgi:hypothetical protein